MEIIEHGSNLQKKSKIQYKFECGHCGCVFIADQEEVEVEKRINGFAWAHCPECNTTLRTRERINNAPDDGEIVNAKTEEELAQERVQRSINEKKLTAQEKCELGGIYDYIDENHPSVDNEKTTDFNLTPVESARYRQFCLDHKHPDVSRGAIGGGTFVSFMPTGLGSCIKVTCGICGGEADITDVGCW